MVRLRVRNLKLGLDEDEGRLLAKVAQKLKIPQEQVADLKLVRKSVDARRDQVRFVYSVEVEVKSKTRIPREVLDSPEISVIQSSPEAEIEPGDAVMMASPLIVGAGPAGLFCALVLASHGYKPVVLEQGKDVDQRARDVESFWEGGRLDPLSNVQFGEGGAGTFSDGKLITRIDDERVNYVINTFISLGAPEEIRYLKRPHLGTDRLKLLIKKMRREIIRLGGRVYFNARVTDILLRNGELEALVINDKLRIDSGVAVLAVGNSGREMFRLLQKKGIKLMPKGFAVGARIEHPQELIDKMQYGKYAGHPRLGPADYHLTYQDAETGRALYTFCMCPGGYIIAASSEPGGLVTNGMSLYYRDSGWANSALVVTVSPSEAQEDPLWGLHFQEQLEKKAFLAGGGNYFAPAQRVEDFLAQKVSEKVWSTYRPGVNSCNLWQVLPVEVCQVMARGLEKLRQSVPDFVGPEAVLVGVETRTSSPLRIERGEDCCSVSCRGLYPCGEGAGYAGGIVSAAVDGVRVAQKIVSTYRRPQRGVQLRDPAVMDAETLG